LEEKCPLETGSTYCVLMNVNGEMIPVETIPRMWERGR
jgi:hypothetical protein